MTCAHLLVSFLFPFISHHILSRYSSCCSNDYQHKYMVPYHCIHHTIHRPAIFIHPYFIAIVVILMVALSFLFDLSYNWIMMIDCLLPLFITWILSQKLAAGHETFRYELLQGQESLLLSVESLFFFLQRGSCQNS
jgi:hypothetical protein